jgi:formylglycine-generating enzyme required for sulfatase activity
MTPASLLSSVTKIVQVNQKHENIPFWLAVINNESLAQRIVDTSWFSQVVSNYRTRYAELQVETRAENTALQQVQGTISIEGLRFLGIPGGQLLQGSGEDGFATYHLPHPVAIPPFYMSETEIPNGLYQAFLAENTDWDPTNTAGLQEQGFVDEEYLEAWESLKDQPGWESLPITNVSFFAAQAFCQWLTTKLPASFSGFTARLPFESEWEWAARGGLVAADYPTGKPSQDDRFFGQDIQGPAPVGESSANGFGLRDMTGNVWEWCLDWYSPTKYLFTSMNVENNSFNSTLEVPIGAEKSIRGGSWVNEQELIKVSTRGFQPPDWSTPYLGFRVVLSRNVP